MINKVIAYEVLVDEVTKTRFAKITNREFHEGLNKMLYNCVSAKGYEFKLSIDEIKFVVH